jgi:2-haloacid dehalogenase
MGDTIVFDVNETLLDVRGLAPRFRGVFGDDALLIPWFSQMLRNALVSSATATYRPFDVQGTDALVTVAAGAGFDLSWADAGDIVGAMGALPPHPDVHEGLGLLKASGFTLAALTNSSPQMLVAQMTNAGLGDYFSVLQSVEPTKRFKPHPEPYHLVADVLGTRIDDLWMVAAHDWDVSGAIRAGMRGAFVARSGLPYSVLGEPPEVTGPDLVAVAHALLAQRSQSA